MTETPHRTGAASFLSDDPTGVLVLADGTVVYGLGAGAEGIRVGELCFNTAMTGYQEVLTDPSYAGQIITFTFPHIGNVGTNEEDVEATNALARGCVLRAPITAPANHRAQGGLGDWLARRDIVAVTGVDTRALTRRIREKGVVSAVVAHARDGRFDIEAMLEKARDWPGLEGMDLVKDITTRQTYQWTESLWRAGRPMGQGYGTLESPRFKVVAIDYGIKRNILRNLASHGVDITVVPATASAEDILGHAPDGVFLSNGPGDPAATGDYAVPAIRGVLEAGLPTFGICLGHQMLSLALGAKTSKMHQGHHGANHPVKNLATGRVEITSMNHGFTVDRDSLPTGVRETHVSLFDGTNAGLEVEGRPVFSVQYHPEASPGPHDSRYLFERFCKLMQEAKA